MSERERWIVYPLLFFALGAAVRDKILHRVDAKEIYCESLKIVDQQDPGGQPLVELSIQRKNSKDPEQFGRLRLLDSAGKEVCQLNSSSLKIASLQDSGKQAFAELAIRQARPNDPTELAEQVGVLRLVDSDGRVVCSIDENAILQRVISRQLDIIDAEQQRRVVVLTEQGPGMLMPNGESTVTTQGAIYLNNQKLGIKIAPPLKREPVPQSPPSASL